MVTSLAYDAAGRVTRIDETADAPLASTEIGWTPAGLIDSVQRTNHAVPTPALGSPPARTFDAASQIGGVTYDERGRPLADGTRTWAWSASDRLLSTTEAGQTTTFEYDAFGSVVARIDASGTTRWRWSYAHTLPCPVEQDAGGVVTYFVCTPDGELLYAIDAATGQRSFFHYDETGNTRLLTDDSGAVTASYAYLPFGQVVGGEGAGDNPFTYSGRYGVIDHPDTDLFHMRRRVYDAAAQRFLTRDPVQTHRDPRSIAPYIYAANDPVRLIDPMGAAPEEANAGGIDARSVVDTLLNVNTNATRAAELGLNKAADTLVDEARQVRRWADVGQSRTDRVAELWKRAQRYEDLAEHNVGLLAGAGDLAGTALAAWDARNDLNAVHSRTLSCQDLVSELYEDYLDAICLSLVDGSIGPDRADELRALAGADFERHLDECESAGWIDTLLVSAEFTEGTLSGAIPAELQWAYSGVKGALSSLGIDNPFVSDAAADGILDSREEVVGGLSRLYDFYGY